MSRLPALKPRHVARVLLDAGFSYVRQKGSHRIYVRGSLGITIPWHSRDIRKGTLRHIIKQSGLTSEEFLNLLRGNL